MSLESICLYFHQDIHVHKCSFLPLTRRFLISMSAVDRGFRLWDQEILDQEAAARQACGMCMCILRMSYLLARSADSSPQSDDSGRRGQVENEVRPI